MKISNTAAVLIIALVLLGLFVLGGCKMGKGKTEQFTRTCTSADTNCKFVRSPVDYAFETMSEIPAHQAALAASTIGTGFPHLMGNPSDELQPLDDPCTGNIKPDGKQTRRPCGLTNINLIKDESLLWHPNKLWKQYENDYKGCGNGKEYIVNDDKTRFELNAVGDVWAARILEHQRLPQHGPVGKHPAITDQDLVEPDTFSQLYGGDWLNQMIGR